MAEFKAGDRVRVKESVIVGAGRTGTVQGPYPGSADGCRDYDLFVDIDGDDSPTAFWWDELELLADKPNLTLVHDSVNKPAHYTRFPVEPIELTEHLSFNLGNVVKYACRAGYKGDALEDLSKALWYLRREIGRLKVEQESAS